MIRFSLKCANGHSFDSWFQSGAAFDALEARGMLTCSVCGDTRVEKALMAPRVAGSDAPAPVPAPPAAKPKPEAMLKAFKRYVEANSTYVGRSFGAEARAIHEGRSEARMIHGEASAREAKALIEDGISVAPLPFLPREKAN